MRHGMICNIEQLKIGHSSPDDDINTARKNYAKAALMLFYPFRGKGDLTKHGSYWCKFESVANCHCRELIQNQPNLSFGLFCNIFKLV